MNYQTTLKKIKAEINRLLLEQAKLKELIRPQQEQISDINFKLGELEDEKEMIEEGYYDP